MIFPPRHVDHVANDHYDESCRSCGYLSAESCRYVADDLSAESCRSCG